MKLDLLNVSGRSAQDARRRKCGEGITGTGAQGTVYLKQSNRTDMRFHIRRSSACQWLPFGVLSVAESPQPQGHPRSAAVWSSVADEVRNPTQRGASGVQGCAPRRRSSRGGVVSMWSAAGESSRAGAVELGSSMSAHPHRVEHQQAAGREW